MESHISGQNTLILVAIPMSGEYLSRYNLSALLNEAEPDDMENQQAVRLAKEADPSGERTIGGREMSALQNPKLNTH